jgi:asparagine synthase (glutamine-hydrolysing)
MTHFAVQVDDRGIHGSPPAAEEDGCVAFWHGYVANTKELAVGHPPGVTVGQLLLHAYRKFGDDLQRHVIGEYVVAIYDNRRRHLLLTHDAISVAPAYWWQRDCQLLVASSLDQLFELAPPPEPDENYLAEYIAWGHAGSHRTAYTGIGRLLAGESLTWHDQRAVRKQTWDLSHVADVHYQNPRDYEERFRELLLTGIKSAVADAQRPWAELSGGLDSSSIVCVAAQASLRLPTLSIVYSRSASADERPWMRHVLNKYQLPWRAVDFDAFPAFSGFPEHVFAQPNATAPFFRFYQEYERITVENGVDVVLSGDGGDHVMMGEGSKPFHLADYGMCLRLSELWRELRHWQTNSPAARSLRYLATHHVLKPMWWRLRGQAVAIRDFGTTPDWMGVTWRRRLRDRASRSAPPGRCRSISEQSYWERIWAFGLAAGVNRGVVLKHATLRHPLLYRPLVEFMAGIPWSMKFTPETDRSLQRAALSGILPKAIRNRSTKAGSQEACFDVFRQSRDWQELLMDHPRLVARGLVNRDRWLRYVSGARYGHARFMSRFLTAAITELWLRQLEKSARRPVRADSR